MKTIHGNTVLGRGIKLYTLIYPFVYYISEVNCSILKVQINVENSLLYFTDFHGFWGVKAESTFVYWDQIACNICILQRSRQGGKFYIMVKAEEKLQFLGGKN